MRTILLLLTMLATTAATTAQKKAPICTPGDLRTDIIGDGMDNALRLFLDEKIASCEIRLIGNIPITAKQVYECLLKAPEGKLFITANGETLLIEPTGITLTEAFEMIRNLLVNEFAPRRRLASAASVNN